MSDTTSPLPQASTAVPPAPTFAERREVAFMDTAVADYQTLVDGVRAGVEVVLIDSSALAEATARLTSPAPAAVVAEPQLGDTPQRANAPPAQRLSGSDTRGAMADRLCTRRHH